MLQCCYLVPKNQPFIDLPFAKIKFRFCLLWIRFPQRVDIEFLINRFNMVKERSCSLLGAHLMSFFSCQLQTQCKSPKSRWLFNISSSPSPSYLLAGCADTQPHVCSLQCRVKLTAASCLPRAANLVMQPREKRAG